MENKNKIYITLAIFILLFLVLVAFCIYPLMKGIQDNSKKLVSDKDKIASLQAQAIETENFSKNYGAYKPNLDKIDQLFVDSSNPVDFIEFLESTASSSQISSKISPLPSAQKTGQNFIIFQLSSKGVFSNVLNFLKKVEAGPYLVRIENLTIQNSEDKNVLKYYSSRIVNATFTIKVFTKDEIHI